jgi:hypothetical protein
MTDGTFQMTPDVKLQPFTYTTNVNAPTVKSLTSTGSGGGGVSTNNVQKGEGNLKKGGGGGGGSKKNWENPYDAQCNTVQRINAELRKREQLERRYQNLLDKANTSAKDLQKNAEDQIASIKQEMQYREGLLEKRKEEMKALEDKNTSKFGKYAWYNEKTGEVEISWDEINKVKDEEKGKEIEDYIKKLEEKEEEIKSEEDALEEQTELLTAIYKQGEDEYFDLE